MLKEKSSFQDSNYPNVKSKKVINYYLDMSVQYRSICIRHRKRLAIQPERLLHRTRIGIQLLSPAFWPIRRQFDAFAFHHNRVL